MNEEHVRKIAGELDLRESGVRAALELLEEGATVPFIARYRKERTGSLDEVAIQGIRDRSAQLVELDKRREAILGSLEERGLLDPDLKEKILRAPTMTELEDLYLPFRPKRRTRGQIARERGLLPLAESVLRNFSTQELEKEAAAFIDPEKGVASVEDALAGARDIVAETVSEDAPIRGMLRELFWKEGIIASTLIKDKETEGSKFRDYFQWQERLARAAGHRILAMFRGEAEGILRLKIRPPEEAALAIIGRKYVKQPSIARQLVEAIADGYGRLLEPSMETEIRNEVKKKVDQEAIAVFAGNLRELLMAAALGQKAVLAIDPGFRTGCKVVCLDPQGKLMENVTIFPTQSERQVEEAGRIVRELVSRFRIEAIAIGNGTGGRETEAFVRGLGLPTSIPIVSVNESGASVYSASEVAREEFPDRDVTVRGAVSIGRRLMDPLAELVKIDPKAIGVGQYQHDVDQTLLRQSLDDVVISCVNAVGVEVNTASSQLLQYVSGLGPQLARNIVSFRNENGPFSGRKDLRKVPRLGPKAFEQAAGFLRLRNSKNPLDASAVHPESYAIVEKMAIDQGCTVNELITSEGKRKGIVLEKYVSENVGMPTLQDIRNELAKPGRDPRAQYEVFAFADGVHKLEDLKKGQELPGIVTNVTKFGAFVDVGVHQDGLVHISQLADRFVRDPSEVVKVGQKVLVRVLEVDTDRKRISLTMKKSS